MSTGPLDGYRVIELGQGIPAAVAAMHLGDGGADVIKVEHRGGDVARTMPPFYAGGDSGVFVAVNRNKRGIELDLTSAAGQDVLRALIRTADVLVEDVDLTRELGLDDEGPYRQQRHDGAHADQRLRPRRPHGRPAGRRDRGADGLGSHDVAGFAHRAAGTSRHRRRQHLRWHLRRAGHPGSAVETRGRR